MPEYNPQKRVACNSKRKIVIDNFWWTNEKFPDATLYEDQLGWTTEEKVQSGGFTETKDVWDSLMNDKNIRGVGWDLCFFYPPTRTFYYIDMIPKVLYKLPIKEDWDGKNVLESVEIGPQITPEEDELMDFEDATDIWNHFKIDGKDMKYILEHSVLFLSS